MIIPQGARAQILRDLHIPHAGLVKTREMARQAFYWPRMINDIGQIIQQCLPCQQTRDKHEQMEPMVLDVADKPMESVGIDLFHFGGKEWLVVVDRYSGFLWVTRLTNTHTGAIVKTLEDLFVRVGFPGRIRSDGGPQFRQEFQQWCSENHISH